MKGSTVFKKFPAWKWAAAALFILFLFAIFSKAGDISADIERRVCEVVAGYGLDCSKIVKVHGRDIVLYGEVPPGSRKDELVKKVALVRGVRTVTDKLKPYVLESPRVKILISQDKISITGHLPETVSLDGLKNKISQKLPGRSIVFKASKGPKVLNKGWVERLPNLVAIAAQVNDAEIEIDDKGVKVAGYVTSQAQKETVGKKLKDVIGGLQLTNWLVVKVPEDILLKEAITKAARDPITFVPGTDQLTKEAKKVLDDIAKTLKEYPGFILEVAAFTDSVGDDEYNLELSQKRAESVVRYLISRGISPNRLLAKGFGEANPVASNESAAGRISNRRIEFRIKTNNKKG